MKRLILAGLTCILLGTGSANATLPDTITGRWCNMGIPPSGGDEHQVYARVRTPASGSCEMNIDQESYNEESTRCTFDKVEQMSANAFLVHATCKTENMTDSGMTASLEIINEKLVITSLPEG